MNFATFGDDGTRGLAAIGVPRCGATLDGALAQARQLVAEGRDNVSITDGKGHTISGPDLFACCLGEKELTPDLRAIPK